MWWRALTQPMYRLRPLVTPRSSRPGCSSPVLLSSRRKHVAAGRRLERAFPLDGVRGEMQARPPFRHRKGRHRRIVGEGRDHAALFVLDLSGRPEPLVGDRDGSATLSVKFKTVLRLLEREAGCVDLDAYILAGNRQRARDKGEQKQRKQADAGHRGLRGFACESQSRRVDRIGQPVTLHGPWPGGMDVPSAARSSVLLHARASGPELLRGAEGAG